MFYALHAYCRFELSRMHLLFLMESTTTAANESKFFASFNLKLDGNFLERFFVFLSTQIKIFSTGLWQKNCYLCYVSIL